MAQNLLLGVAPSSDLWNDCNYYKLWKDRVPNGYAEGAYGYIEECGGTCDLSKFEKIGECGGGASSNCNDLCRNHGPFVNIKHDSYCGTRAEICRKLRGSFRAIREGKQIDCCSYTDLNILMGMDCPPDMYTGSEGCKRYLVEFCEQGKNIENPLCAQFKTIDLERWKRVANRYCVAENTDGERFKTQLCQDYCKDNKQFCEDKLNQVCSDKKPDNPDVGWLKVCGCHFPNDIYVNFATSMESKWQAPEGTFRGERPCLFPLCKEAYPAYQQDLARPCPTISLTSCLQNITVDARGAAISGGSIIPTQIQACGNSLVRRDGGDSRVKCSTDNDCAKTTGTVKCGSDGYCRAPTPSDKTCSSDGDCTSLNTSTTEGKCIGGVCLQRTIVPKPRLNSAIIIGIIIAAILLIGVIAVLLLTNKPKTSKSRATIYKTKTKTITPSGKR